jgi:hypothetical protein
MYLLGPFGIINNPFDTLAPTAVGLTGSSYGSGLTVIVSNLVRFAIVIAGVYTLFNLIIAGYGYLSAGGDPKAVQKAQERIWRSFVGLAITAGSFVVAAIIGFLFFGADNWNILISPRIYGFILF